jgi:hypothetical protein
MILSLSTMPKTVLGYIQPQPAAAIRGYFPRAEMTTELEAKY